MKSTQNDFFGSQFSLVFAIIQFQDKDGSSSCCKDELEVADREVVICKGAKCQLTALVSVVDGASSAG